MSFLRLLILILVIPIILLIDPGCASSNKGPIATPPQESPAVKPVTGVVETRAPYPITAKLFVSEAPGLNKPVLLTGTVSSRISAPGTTVQIKLPDSVTLVSGTISWQGDLKPGEPVSFSAEIVFNQVGEWEIVAFANYYVAEEKWAWGDIAEVYVTVGVDGGKLGWASGRSETVQPLHGTSEPWKIETVDSRDRGGLFSTIALDASGNPHIVYRVYLDEREKSRYKHAYWNGKGWQIEPLPNHPVTLAKDKSGNHQVIYLARLDDSLAYASLDGESRPIKRYDNIDILGGGSSTLALDSSGNPHVIGMITKPVLPSPYVALKYARWDGRGWQTSISGIAYSTSMALDSSGQPHISFIKRGSSIPASLKYASWDGQSWQIGTVDSEGSIGLESSLALDSSNNPHIIYTEMISDTLKYARLVDDKWHISTVEASTDSDVNLSLALDSSGNPHMVYGYKRPDAVYSDLRYAFWDGENWHVETVVSQGYFGWAYVSLALDDSGNPHISYWGRNRHLMYASYDKEASTVPVN